MSDVLNPAAEALVKTLLEFKEHAQEAVGTFEELRESIEEHDQGLEEDWTAFTEAVQSLLDAVAERDAELGPKGDQAGAAVEHLGTLIPQVQEALAESLRESAEQLDDLAEQAENAESEAERLAAEGAESPAGRVGDQLDHVEKGVEATAEEGVRSIREGFVEQAETAVTDAESLVDATKRILDDRATWVKQAVVAWTSQMTQVEDTVALEGFRKAGPHAERVVDHAIQADATAPQTVLEEVERLVGEARQHLAELEEAVKEANGELDGSAEETKAQTGELLVAMSEATEALQKVAALFAAYELM